MKSKILILFVSIWLVACAASTETPLSSPTPPTVVDVFATAATQPWLSDLYTCASQYSIIIRITDLPASADIYLRLGEPPALNSLAYQIDTEEILIVTHRQSPVQNISLEEVRAIFAGFGTQDVDVWVFAEGEDIQQVFDVAVMGGQLVTSQARLAATPQQMGDTLNNTPNAIGILPRHWKAGDSRFVYTITDVPVLAVTKEEPQGSLQNVLACMQEKTAP